MKTVILVSLGCLVGATVLSFAIPYFYWGPAPIEEVAHDAYVADQTALLNRLVTISGIVIVVTYYRCVTSRDVNASGQDRSSDS